MLSVEQNERVTQTAPGTPAGNLLRHYWQPVALCEELDPSRPVAAVTVLGESLVLFRNEHGELGDTSTLADPTVVNDLVDNRMNL